MKASAIYREAARALENSADLRGCCDVIYDAANGDEFEGWSALAKHMRDLFAEEERMYWMGDLTSRNHELRIVALCFMAAIAEDEERGKGRRSS